MDWQHLRVIFRSTRSAFLKQTVLKILGTEIHDQWSQLSGLRHNWQLSGHAHSGKATMISNLMTVCQITLD